MDKYIYINSNENFVNCGLFTPQPNRIVTLESMFLKDENTAFSKTYTHLGYTQNTGLMIAHRCDFHNCDLV